nr:MULTISPECIES: hypothetical protein [unclassified Coleofasciculus]
MWRGIFATLTGAGLVILGSQDGVFRRTNEWYWLITTLASQPRY